MKKRTEKNDMFALSMEKRRGLNLKKLISAKGTKGILGGTLAIILALSGVSTAFATNYTSQQYVFEDTTYNGDTFKNINTGMSGGAVFHYSASKLVINATLFENNTAAGQGGAMFTQVSSTDSSISNSSFNLNKATGTNGHGGAIYLTNLAKFGNIITTMFNGNTANVNGGAIFNAGTLGDMTWLSFTNNTATTGAGGAIYNYYDNTTAAKIGNLSNVTFAENTAYTDGGAIYNTRSEIGTLTNVDFLANEAGAMGGAIYNNNYAKIGNMDTVTFSNNEAGTNGGAISNNFNSEIGTLTDVLFAKNEAVTNGGAIYNLSNSTIGALTGVEFTIGFTENKAGFDGGAIYNAEAGIIGDMLNVSFEDNKAGRDGGAIFNGGNTAKLGTLTNVQFLKNEAVTNGGAIYNGGVNSEISGLDRVLFEENKAGQGGAIYNAPAAASKPTIGALTKVNFIGNEAVTNGGAVYNGNGAIIGNMDTTLFEGNIAGTNGGAIFNHLGGSVIGTLTDMQFIGNAATAGLGGAIANYGNSSIGDLTDIEFTGNTAGLDGGALYNAEYGTIGDLLNIKFENNESGTDGGAIYNGRNTAKIGTLTDIEFTGNEATNAGGAIYNGGVNSEIGALTNILFEGNKAGTDGGAIYNAPEAGYTVTLGALTDVYFIKNEAANNGGAIYNSGALTLHSGQFTGNLANGVANSIHNTGALIIDIDEDEGLDMRDQMTGAGGAIAKNGNGTWYLGGNSVFTDSTMFDVNAGTLYLFQKGEVANANRLNENAMVQTGKINLSGANSSFNLADGALLVIGVGEIHEINSEGSLTMESGSEIGINYDGLYNGGPITWTKKDILTLESFDLDNQSIVVNPEAFLEEWAYDITINAKWNNEDDPTTRDTLSLISYKELNHDRGGSYSGRASDAIALNNPTNEVIMNRQKALLAGKAEVAGYLWGTGFYNFSQLNKIGRLDGYTVKTPGIALGYDDIVNGQQHFMGLAVIGAFPEYKSGNVITDGHDVRFNVYGGTTLDSGFELNYMAGYGFGSINQDRNYDAEVYSADYDYNTLNFSAGVAKELKQTKDSFFRPYANYEYLRVNTDGYSEGGAGDYDLSVKGKNSNISRVRAGLDYVKELSDKENNYVRAGLFWQGQYGDINSNSEMYFNTDPVDSNFVNSTKIADENSLGVTLGFGTAIGEDSDLRLNYTGIYSSNANTHDIGITFAHKF